MLSWRILQTVIALALLLSMAWLDEYGPRPGLVMLPLALVGAMMCVGEFLGLFASAERHGLSASRSLLPTRWVVFAGTLLVVVASTAPVTFAFPDGGRLGFGGWMSLGLALALMLVVGEQMRRFQGVTRPDGTIAIRIARAMLVIAYLGISVGFMIGLRILEGPHPTHPARWGLLALLTMVAIVKMSDSGAYITGHAIGRHKMAPKLSPGKTWEGFAGGMVAAVLGALLFLGPIAQWMGCDAQVTGAAWWIGVISFAIVVALAGVVGDLAISLLKRDAGVKDSSTWMPGFGGFLDLLDSILLAAPVAYLLWVAGIVGPALLP